MMAKRPLIITWLFIFLFAQNISFPGDGIRSQSRNGFVPSIFHATILPQLIRGASAKAKGAGDAEKDDSVKKKE